MMVQMTEEQRRLPAHRRPTLVIGLGGTGHRMVLYLKQRLLQAYGEVPEQWIRLLVFDTADEALEIPWGTGTISLEKDREHFHIGHTPVPNIVRNLARQPAIAARLPNIHTLPAVALRNGARQLRPLGLLALLWRFEEVEQRIGDAIWTLAGKESLGRREGKTQGINVVIGNSLVGGTGSGMFLDIAYLVRDLFASLGSMGDFCYITGIGALPQAFRSVDGPNLAPNAVAALKELSHGMLHGGFSCQYPNGRWIQTPHPPFDLYYLVDGVDEQGYTWRGVGDLATMVATGMFLQIGSQVGLKGDNDFDNLSDVLSGQTAEGEGTFCGSFGVATLTFPAAAIADWCAARLAEQMIAQGLLGPVDAAAAEARAQDFAQQHIPDVAALRQQLSQDDEGIPLTVDPGAAPWLRQSGRAVLPSEVIRYVQDYSTARVQGDYRTWIRANGQALAATLAQGVADGVQGWLGTPDIGVAGVLAHLQHLRTFLAARSTVLETERAAAERERRQLELALHAQEQLLRQAADTLFLWRGRAVNAARERYLDIATALLTWQVQEYVDETGLTVLNMLVQAVTGWQQQLERVQAALGAARRRFAAHIQTFTATYAARRTVADITLAEAAYCEQLYAREAPPVAQILAELLRECDPAAWADAPLDTVVAELHTAARQPFAQLAAMTVEDALRERAAAADGQATSPAAYKERLVRLAAPAWNLDLTRLEDGGSYLQTIQVLGVPDEANSHFQTQTRMLVSTHDPTAITAFVATIGAPFSALQQYPDYARQYQLARRMRALHVLPQFQTEDSQAKLAFALGILYTLIFNRGVYFYYRPEDPLDPPLKLDSGLENAVRCFAQSDTLVQEVMMRVEQRIAEMGTRAALEKLAAYYQANGHERAPDMILEMRKLVRAYAEELQSTQQAFGDERGELRMVN